MTAATLKKYRTYLTDDNGKPVMVQLDLRNKRVKQAYEDVMNKLETEMIFENINQIKNDPENTWTDFFEVTNEILANKKLKAQV